MLVNKVKTPVHRSQTKQWENIAHRIFIDIVVWESLDALMSNSSGTLPLKVREKEREREIERERASVTKCHGYTSLPLIAVDP